MADRPTERIKVSCAHCGTDFLVSAKERSTASCPKCNEPLNAPTAGIVRRKERKKSISGIISTLEPPKATSTFLGAPMALQAELREAALRAEEKADPSSFKEALAMSRMEMKLEPTFFDPPDPFEFDQNEPTLAISLTSEVNDTTKPPPGMFTASTKSKTRKAKALPTFSSRATSAQTAPIGSAPMTKPEPPTIPMAALPAIDPPGEAITIPSLPKLSLKPVEVKKKFRKNMKTSQLSDLLKKAKKDKQTIPNFEMTKTPPKVNAKGSAIALNKSPTKPVINVPKSIKDIPSPSEDSLLIQLQALDKKHDPKPGFASENRGSGFIKLPTTDILDVLGKGQYRLRVQGIIYEPVDEKGLTQLIKGGVLLGAEDIAEAHGDWMPISEHPVFSGLRKRMAKEAHALLSKVAQGKPEKKEFPKATHTEKIKQTEPEKQLAKTESDDRPDPVLSASPTTAPPSRTGPKPTMQMFAMRREDPAALVSPSVASSLEDMIERVQTIEGGSPSVEVSQATDDQTVERVFEDSESLGVVDTTESEISIATVKAKKKSAPGIFLVVVVLVGVLLAGVIYADSQGLLESLTSSNKNTDIEKKQTLKKVPLIVEKEKEVEKEIAVVNPDKKEEIVDPKEEPLKDVAPLKVEKTSDAVPIKNLQNAKFIGKASGKRLAMIFEKEGSAFLLIPETEKGGLKRIVAAQKLCELLACPFVENKVSEVTIDVAELKKSGAKKAKMLINEGKIKALIQPLSKSSFSVSATATWRPILRASKKARQQDLTKWMAEKNLALSNSEFSRQLSGILLRDYLINDWSRFESKPSHIGIENGKLVDQGSIVAFEARASGRVKGRFGWSSVFPAEMVDRLEKLDRKSTLELLFPNASTTDKSRFSVFWKQRASALSRIKTLAAKSGKENVLLIK